MSWSPPNPPNTDPHAGWSMNQEYKLLRKLFQEPTFIALSTHICFIIGDAGSFMEQVPNTSAVISWFIGRQEIRTFLDLWGSNIMIERYQNHSSRQGFLAPTFQPIKSVIADRVIYVHCAYITRSWCYIHCNNTNNKADDGLVHCTRSSQPLKSGRRGNLELQGNATILIYIALLQCNLN